MCGKYYIDSDMADEIKKVVNDIDQRIRQEQFTGDICPTNVAPVIEKSEHGMKLEMLLTGNVHYECFCKKITMSMDRFWKLSQ